jgi:hypothetical protein
MRAASHARSPMLRRLPRDEESCVFNGIDGATGQYLLPPLSQRQVADLARREPRYYLPDSLESGAERSSGEKGPAEGVDPRDLGQTGWGVIFARSVTPAVREALAPLLGLRKSQASRVKEGRFLELDHRLGESKTGFLSRHGIAPGPAEPDRMPYYLLLVGDPAQMPFEFQYQLDVQYAVGRIHFETLGEYDSYARTVVEAESGRVRRPPAAAFFAPRHHGDRPTQLSAVHLAAPLAAKFAGEYPNWSVRTALADEATKGRLEALLAGPDTPALLFTAGHGLCFHSGDKRQLSLQGSLICQDWQGPGQPLQDGHVLAADDVPESARIAGMIAFHFSCFGAGTPRFDGFPQALHGHREIAPRAFLSRLSRRLLAHPAGGALAVVGHVDRAWSWSFTGLTGDGPTLRPVFENTLKRLANGYPIGYAMEFFNSCYAELASDLDDEIKRATDSRDERLAQLWTGRNDARNYAVLGDPAVRLAVPPPQSDARAEAVR